MIFGGFFEDFYFDIKIQIFKSYKYLFWVFLTLKITTDLPSARVWGFWSVGQDLFSFIDLQLLFTLKFGKRNAETRNFQDCVIKESIRCESVSADLDAISESAIDDVNRQRQ